MATLPERSRLLAFLPLLALAACEPPKAPVPGQNAQGGSATAAATTEVRVEGNPDRNAYFGETHIHTSLSVDAWLLGNRVTGPDDALKYAQGETIKHPLGYDIKIETPMDFMGVTDHSEYVGVTKAANTPGTAISKMPEAQPLIIKDLNNQEEVQKVFLYLLKLASSPPIKAFMSPEVAGSIWKDNVRIADENNHPGKFTAFCSYEWTSFLPANANMHRNIFFRDCTHVPPMPYSALDSKHPEDLWNWMDAQRKAGNELLAISHNANVSDGYMYPVDVDSYGRPIDAAWAAARDRNERLVEIKQIKGASETHPLLSPTDEFAGYEIFSGLLGLPVDSGRVAHITGSYARQALKDGLAMQDVRGYNPYKFGVGAASDSHNTASPYRQENFYGGHVQVDGTVERRLAGVMLGGTIDARLENPAGLTGVWAEENTRASLFDAMYRKETFGVSGPHIKVRFFGGWGYGKEALEGKDWVHRAYADGVPMGGDLKPMPAGKGVAPTFVAWAVKDPTSANLDRIQVIKGWTQNGQSFEKIFDVAWSGDRKPEPGTGRIPAIRSTVDLEKATYTNDAGSTELKAVWSDPEFDASLHAFYYARVLEIPTPRWTLIQAVKAGVPPPDVVPLTGQERAWTSPIWYTPSAEARKSAPAGTTVADLKAKGATVLNDGQLKSLIVGKSLWIRNNVTGEAFSENFTAEGQTTVFHAGKTATLPSGTGNVIRDGYQGTTTTYRIDGGRLITYVSQDPYAITVYKAGDTYYGARSNEFGYANYEIIPAPQIATQPIEMLVDTFAVKLRLTEQQKQQIIPILKEEMPQLKALKNDASLGAAEKIRKLREIGASIDAKVTPLLNPEQQQAFQGVRETLRHRLVEKAGEELAEKVESRVSGGL